MTVNMQGHLMSECFDLLIFVIERDLPLLRLNMPYLRHFLRPKRCVFVASSACLESLGRAKLAFGSDLLLDEDSLVPGLSLGAVRDLVVARSCPPERAGWYFKQIAIFAYAFRADAGERYLCWDADTVPVRDISFFDDHGRALLARKREHHRSYFGTIERLTGLKRQAKFSFIAEHMLFERELVRELVAIMLGGRKFDGALLAHTILGAVDDRDLPASGFSEYETYGTFVYAKRRERISVRRIASIRHGTAFFRRLPTAAQLFTISRSFFWASFESWDLSRGLQRLLRVGTRLFGVLWVLLSLATAPGAYARFKREIDAARD